MIYGIGTDIVEIARIQKVCEGNNRFLKRYYTEREQEMICQRKQRGAACAAVNFAGKEAVAKALKTRQENHMLYYMGRQKSMRRSVVLRRSIYH